MIVHQVISGKSGGKSSGRGRGGGGDVSEGIVEGIAEVVAHLGVYQFAVKIRATDQLRRLYMAWRAGVGYDERGISNKGMDGGVLKDTPIVSQRLHSQSQPQQQTKPDQNGTKHDADPSNNSNNNSSNSNHSNPTLTSTCAYPSIDTFDTSIPHHLSPGTSSVCGSLMTMMERYCLNDTPY